MKHDPLLAIAGYPPFGANGLALNTAGNVLYVANSCDDRVLKLELGSNEITVTNLALPLNGVAGDEPEEDVTRWTVSRIRIGAASN